LPARQQRATARGPKTTSSTTAAGTIRAPSAPPALPFTTGTLENVIASRMPSARRLIRVCENTVPPTIASCCFVLPCSRRLITTTRAASPTRPGKTAEPSTPIIVARITGGQGTGMSGSAARSSACQEIARITSDVAISASASTTQAKSTVESACPTRLRLRLRSANATSPATSSRPST
jgi:hypothetical protein